MRKRERRTVKGEKVKPKDKAEAVTDIHLQIRGDRIEQWQVLQPYGGTWSLYIKRGHVLKKMRARLRLKNGDRILLMKRKVRR